jgi:hypothetical protein
MEPWLKALVGSVIGGLALATIAVNMGMRRMEILQGVTFSKTQKWRAWWTIFAVFSAFGFFIMSLTQQ